MAEFFLGVDVFIRQIDAAGEGGAAIDDQDFPMIPVIIVGRHEGTYRGEGFALDAQFLKLFGIAGRECGDGTGAIVEDPDLHTGLSFPVKDIQHPIPHLPRFDDEVLQKDVFFCRLHLAKHLVKGNFAQRKISASGVGVDFCVSLVLQIVGNVRQDGRFIRFLHMGKAFCRTGMDDAFDHPVPQV